MAAHQVNGLIETLCYIENHRAYDIADEIKRDGILDLSCWTEQAYVWWCQASDYVEEMEGFDPEKFTTDDIERAVALKRKFRHETILALGKAIQEWEELGFPESLEDWRARKHTKREEDDGS